MSHTRNIKIKQNSEHLAPKYVAFHFRAAPSVPVGPRVGLILGSTKRPYPEEGQCFPALIAPYRLPFRQGQGLGVSLYHKLVISEAATACRNHHQPFPQRNNLSTIVSNFT